MNSSLIPFKQALFWVLLSVVCTIGPAVLALFYYRSMKQWQSQDDAYRIVAIVQTTPSRDPLKTSYLAEWLRLSVDHPTNLYRFHEKEACCQLSSHPVIKKAQIKKIFPGTVHVDYCLREPIAFLGDYANAAVDEEGVIFPFHPFFTPKRLPEIYLGLAQLQENEQEIISSINWGQKIEDKRIELVFNILADLKTICQESICGIRLIDVSKAFALSSGRRQVAVIVDETYTHQQEGQTIHVNFPRILRLDPENYKQALANYVILNRELRKKELLLLSQSNKADSQQSAVVIEMRLPQLAFIQRNNAMENSR